jgi:steroid 5-alpha reductase family enzyme
MIWGVRLSAFLLFRIIKTGKDDRFDGTRDKFFPFLGFWIFQMIWVWTCSLPVTVLNSPNVTMYRQPDFGTGRDIAGVIIYTIGLAMEGISDMEKFKFRSRNDRSAVCDTGLFYWSRHPNYFGEIIIQFGKHSLSVPNEISTIMFFLHSYIYDCDLSSSRWLCPGPSIQRALRNDRRTLLPDHPFNVHIRAPAL